MRRTVISNSLFVIPNPPVYESWFFKISMTFAILFLTFLFSLVVERTFLPIFLGLTLPLSFWVAAMGMLFVERVKILLFALLSGFVAYFTNLSFPAEAFLLFVCVGLISFAVSQFFEQDRVTRDLLTLSSMVFAFQFLQPLIVFFLNPSFAPPPSASLLWGGFFINAAFVAFFSVCLFIFKRRAENKRAEYV